MNITKELREWLSNRAFLGNGYAELIAIADRIDMEHERRMVERADRYSELRAKMNNCYIELPKDADSEYIHVGDELCNYTLSGYPYPNGGVYCKAIINERMVLVGQKESSFKELLMWEASWCHHYHAPTVEDVLREFTNAILEWSGKSGTVAEVGTWSDVAAKYAAKLQLKEY